MLRKLFPGETKVKGGEKARKRQKGFTLIEMLAVVIILVIVAAIGFVLVNNQIQQSRLNTDEANIRTVADAVQRYIMEKNELPGGVAALVDNGYLAAAPKDPWGDHEGDDYITIEPDEKDENDVIVKSAHTNKAITLKGANPDTDG